MLIVPFGMSHMFALWYIIFINFTEKKTDFKIISGDQYI
jgi:hypothetical protein